MRAKIIFLFFFFYSITILPQSSKWIWQNPQPQGNNLLSINIFNDTWWAVTDLDILKSTNKGTDWQYLYHSGIAGGYVKGLNFINENIGFVIEGHLLLKTTNGGLNWTPVSTFTFQVNECKFLDENTGFLFGLGAPPGIYRTTDGGKTWSSNLITFSTTELLDYSFGDDNTFWVSSTYFVPDPMGDEYFYLYKTTNQGNSWIQQYSPTSPLLCSFLNPDSGYIIAGTDLLFTSNGGSTWNPLSDLPLSPQSVIFLSTSTGYFISNETIYKTSDKGQSWNIILQANYLLTDIKFINENTGAASGWMGYLIYTTDGGTTWISNYRNAITTDLNCIQFTDPQYGWAAGNFNGLVKTIDSGKTWQQVNLSPLQQDFRALFFFNKDTGYVGGCMLYKTTDSGLTWTSIITGDLVSNIQFLTPDIGFVLAYNNFLWITTDGGTQWFARTVPYIAQPTMFFTNLNTGFIGGIGKLLKTTDGGLNWSTQYDGDFHFTDIFFLDQLNGWAMNYGTKQFKTTDGGNNWIEVSTRNIYMPKVYFKDEKNGWAVEHGSLIFTTDGGLTWSDIDEYSLFPFNEICGAGNGIWAAGANGQIVKNNEVFIPVELLYFSASSSEKGIILSWKTSTETNNKGFEVQRKTVKDFETISFVNGKGTTTQATTYTYSDKEVNSGTYSYRLKQVDLDGSFKYSEEVNIAFNIPGEFALFQCYPNPFNPSTKIKFSIPSQQMVEIKIYNVLGKEVALLVREELSPGTYEREWNASNNASGVYYYRVTTKGFTETKKLLLIK